MPERESFLHRLRMLEIRAACVPVGSVRNRVGTPSGAVYAMEMTKEDERKKRDPNYIPLWSPGKETSSTSKAAKGDIEDFLKNPLFSDEEREEIRQRYG